MILLMNYWQLGSFCMILISLPYWPKIPDLLWSSVFVVTFLVITSARCRLVFNYSLGISIGLLWAIVSANIILEQSSTLFRFGENINIKIKVDSYFTQNNFGFNGQVRVTSINGQTLSWYQQPRVQLYTPVMLQRGDTGQFYVTIKPILGLLNQAGIDSERFYFGKAILGKAFTDRKTPFYIIEHSSWRTEFKQHISERIADYSHESILMALSFADRAGINSEQWKWLKASGLSHLVAISGLHISIAFGIGFTVMLTVSRIIRRGAWCAFPVGIALATSYSWLADFTLPTQRALTMLLISIVIIKISAQLSYFQRMLWVLTIVLSLNPLAVVSNSFWLSFLAVSIVVYIMLGQTSDRWLFKWLKSNVLLCIAMLPLSAIMFSGVSLVSPLYNMLFIPWFSFVVIPILFLALLSSFFGFYGDQIIWALVDRSLMPLSYLLPYSNDAWLPLATRDVWCLTAVVALFVFMPLLRRRWFILIILGSALVSNRQSRSDWRIDMLDVGQGLAVLIEQNGEYLLYDTGPAWSGGSAANFVITPILERRGVKQLDTLILSHLDNDHAGGRIPIEQRWNPKRRMTSTTLDNYTSCIQGQNWQWHQLNIEVLWPPVVKAQSKNQFSCVLKVSDKTYGHSVILTGDIDAVAEWLIVKQVGAGKHDLKSDIIVVPHHGSLTSSTSQFIRAINPSLALTALAKGNRWNFPNPKVKQRYQSMGVKWLDTGDAGQITINFNQDKRAVSYLRSNETWFHYQPWYRQMLRKQVE